MTQTTVELIKIALAISGMAAVVMMARKKGGRNLTVFAGLLAATSAAAYIRFGNFHWQRFLNSWDLFHYYMGAEYFDELGYYDLYRCVLEADSEIEGELALVDEVRDLRTLRYVSSSEHMRGQRQRCSESFSAERWSRFKADLEFFYTITPQRTWSKILVDKGYNGTPAWTAYVSRLTHVAGPASSPGLTALCALDEVLIVFALLGVYWAFGLRAFLVATIFVGVNFATRFQHVGGSLLRMDWFAFLLLSLCALKKERWATSGVFLALATAARVFPIVFAAGIVVRALFSYSKERKLPKGHLRFGLALGLTLGAMGLLGGTTGRGFAAWAEFAEVIGPHSAEPAGKRIGLKYVILPLGRLDPEPANDQASADALRQRWEHRKYIAWGIGLLALFMFVLAARQVNDLQAFALGAAAVFFLLAPTRYYWAMLAIPVVAWSQALTSADGDLETPKWQSDGVIGLFFMQILLFLIHLLGAKAGGLSVVSSFCLCAVFSFVLWALAGEQVRTLWRRAMGKTARG